MSITGSSPGRHGRIPHWVVAGVFFIMFATGLIFFVDGLSSLAQGGFTRYVHRVGAAVLVGIPLLYAVTHPGAARLWLKEAMFWRRPAPGEDVASTWQRIHKALVAGGLLLLVITGGILWFLKGSISSSAFLAVITVHDVLFIAAACVVLYHVYYEFDWWMWRRKFCRNCASLACAGVCPNAVMMLTETREIELHMERCNNCRHCMQACRRTSLFRKTSSPITDRPSTRSKSGTRTGS